MQFSGSDRPRWQRRVLDFTALLLLGASLAAVYAWDGVLPLEVGRLPVSWFLAANSGRGDDAGAETPQGTAEPPAPVESPSPTGPVTTPEAPDEKSPTAPVEPEKPATGKVSKPLPGPLSGAMSSLPIPLPGRGNSKSTRPGPSAASQSTRPRTPSRSGGRMRTPARGTMGRADLIVDQFIMFDIGRLPGPQGIAARDAFNRLGTESIPAVVRGLNKAACLSQSCPVIVLTSKLRSLLAQTRDPDTIAAVMEHLGDGVPLQAPYCRSLMDLKQGLIGLLPTDDPRRRAFDLLASAGADPAILESALRSESAEDKLAALLAARWGGVPLGDDFVRLLDDPDEAVSQAARAVLSQLAPGKDFGPEPDASPEEHAQAVNDWRFWWKSQAKGSVFARVGRQSEKVLRKTLQDGDPNERLAAVMTVRTRGLRYCVELIDLLRDEEVAVRREARQALRQLANGRDFGPEDDADEAAVEQAVTAWQTWQRLEELVAKYSTAPPAAVVAAFQQSDPLERLAAVCGAHQQGLNVPEKLIPLLRDEEEAIRLESRHALVDLAGGADYGPSEQADAATIDAAAQRWEQWLTWSKLVNAYSEDEPEAIVARFREPDPIKRSAAAVAARRRNLPVADQFISLLRDPSADVQQEAHQALVQLAGDCDFGPAATANQAEVERAVTAWTQWMQRERLVPKYESQPPEALVQAFRSTEPMARWAAVVVVRRRGLTLPEELLSLIRDPDDAVRQEVRQALKQLSNGEDHGPPEAATESQCELAYHAWEGWWRGEKGRREETAQRQLKMAAMLVEKNPLRAKQRLEDIIEKFDGTDSRREAQELLAKVERMPMPHPKPTEKPASPSPKPGPATAKSPPASERSKTKPPSELAKTTPAAERADAQRRERDADNLLRLLKRTLQNKPRDLREGLEEVITRYAGTRAAQEAQRLLQTLPSGSGRVTKGPA